MSNNNAQHGAEWGSDDDVCYLRPRYYVPAQDPSPEPSRIVYNPPGKSWMDSEAKRCLESRIELSYEYVAGDFHPIALGDILDGRFRVVHKLGSGGGSTQWLCHDNVSNKWRSVEIMMARPSAADRADLRALEQLKKNIDPGELAANHIQLPLEHFWIDGPNGRHLCLVLPFLGPSLLNVWDVYGHVPELMKYICFQMVEALKFLHARSLCHGEFEPGRIHFKLADGVDEWKEEAIMDLLGEPVLETSVVLYEYHLPSDTAEDEELRCGIERKPGEPKYLVGDSYGVPYGSGVYLSEIAVLGFGASYLVSPTPVSQQHSKASRSLAFHAPETAFGLNCSPSFHNDVWALGASIAHVRCGFVPFDDECLLRGTRADTFTIFRGAKNMELLMGPMPQPYRTKDETVYATVDPQKQESLQKEWISEGRSPILLKYCLQGERSVDMGHQQAADVAAQAAANPGWLPACKTWSDKYQDGEFDKDNEIVIPEEVEFRMPDAEVEQLFDLFVKIFRWHPEQRATLDEIANHEWFGDRNQRRRLGA